VKQLFLLLLVAVTVHSATGQDSTHRRDKRLEKRERINSKLKLEEEGEAPFKKYNLFSLLVASDGYGIFFEKGIYKTPKRILWYRVELTERKDPREQKVANSINLFSGQVNSSVYGKLNNFYPFKLGVGQQYLIGGKANKSGVAVSVLYGGGISLGLLKPYYVDAKVISSQTIERVTFDSFYVNPLRYGDYPVGAAGVTYGWSGLKVKPGLHSKAAMRFDYGRFNEMITAIEAGLNVEYYFQDIRQLVEKSSTKLFFNAYLALAFGRRK
jgi:hypothetical protein